MKITKMPKRLAEPVAEVQHLLRRVSSATDDELPDILDSISEWCWPRGDLHFWAPTLNRFDTILEQACRDYDLHKLQYNEFTPLHKRLVVSILNFSRLLIENSTSRKLYNSYEHINSLLFTRDIEVLEATLRLLLRFAQQYSGQSLRSELQVSQKRVATLAVVWAPRDHSVDSVDLAKNGTLPEDFGRVRFQYYRHRRNDGTSQSASASAQDSQLQDGKLVTPSRSRPRDRTISGTPQQNSTSTPAGPSHSNVQEEGMATIDLGNVNANPKDAMDILVDATEEHSIPAEDHYELYQKIRFAKSMADPEQRRKLLVCRLMAIACYGHITSESTASSQLFLYEPDIVQRTAALVKPEHGLSRSIVAAALYSLDALGRYRSKLNEVLSSLSASVNHGVLMQVLRYIIDELATGRPSLSNQQLIDSFYGLVGFVTSTTVGSSLIVGAGLVQLMVQLIDQAKPEAYIVQRSITRAVGLLDSIFYSHLPAFNLFCQARGVETFVRSIHNQVAQDIERTSNAMSDDGEPSDSPYGKLTFGRAHLLRGFLQSISHMMVSTGTAEGLRNLIDTSLLSDIKLVMEHRKVFGPQNLALCINIVSTFVHNEPTSLGVIQEKKLPETFLELIKTEIEPHVDVINAIPNAVGALCLNQAGLDRFSSEPIVPKLLSLLTSDKHVKVLLEQDNITVFGGSIDELIRHQPTLKQSVIDHTIELLKTIHKLGQEFVAPPQENVSAYLLEKASIESKELATGDDPAHLIALAEVIKDDPDATRNEAVKDVNSVARYIDVTARFLEIFFQSANHCRDFLKADGLSRLLSFYSLPCISHNFASSTAADSIVHLLRFISESSPMMVVQGLLSEVKKALDETKPLWSELGSDCNMVKLLYPTTDEELAACNAQYRQLVKLNAIIQLLTDVTPAFTYTNPKTAIAFLQVLHASVPSGSGDANAATLLELGQFQQSWIWQGILLRAASPTLAPSEKQAKSDKPASSGGDRAGSVPADASVALAQADDTISKTFNSLQRDDPVMKNATALRFIISQIKIALSAFFSETNRLLISRRPQDSTYKRLITSTANGMAKNLSELLIWQSNENGTLSCAYATEAITQCLKLLYDDRVNHVHAQTAVLAPFLRQGGLGRLVTLSQALIDELDLDLENGARWNKTDLMNAVRLGHTCSALRLCLDLFLKLVTAKYLLESPSTANVTSKDGVSRTSEDYFKPHEALITIRRTILPVALQLWNKPSLQHLPFEVNRSLLRILLQILEAEGEDKPAKSITAESGTSANGESVRARQPSIPAFGQMAFRSNNRPRPSTLQPDESRITQLMDMGFPRRAARNALIRCANNLSAAAEYLLVHPEIVTSMMDDVEEEPNAANGETEEQGEPSGSSEVANATSEQMQELIADETPQAAVAEGESSGVAATSEAADVEMNDGQPASEARDTAVSKPASPSEGEEDRYEVERKSLTEEREKLLPQVVSRALFLADTYPALVYEVKIAVHLASASFTKSETLVSLFDDLKAKADTSCTTSESAISVRLHLLALTFNDTKVTIKLTANRATQFMSALHSLVLAAKQFGKRTLWFASLFLVLAAVIRTEYEIEPVTIEEKASETNVTTVKVNQTPLFQSESVELLDFCLAQFDDVSSFTSDDLLALYRFIVILTTGRSLAIRFREKEGLSKILRPFSTLKVESVSSSRPLVSTILRNIVESDAKILRATIRDEIVAWFRQQRTKSIDTTTLSRGLGYVMLRDPDMFLDVITNDLKLQMIDYTPNKSQGLVKPLPDNVADAVTASASQEGAVHDDVQAGSTLSSPTKPIEQNGEAAKLDSTGDRPAVISVDGTGDGDGGVVHFCLSELLRFVRERERDVGTSDFASSVDGQAMEVDRDGKNATRQARDNAYFNICYLLQALTELVSSYLPCKTAFLSFSSKKRSSTLPVGANPVTRKEQTPVKPKGNHSALAILLTELVPSGFICSREYEDLRRSMSISNWAMSVLVALCADVTMPPTKAEKRSYVGSAEVSSSRKAVLDALSKAIKETTTVASAPVSREPVEARYGRLYALSDLTYRLLKAKPNSSPNGQNFINTVPFDDSALHLAKTMLERNFVTALTGALSEIDLNLPTVKPLLERILRPLEHLTKIAIKMNRAERKDESRRNRFMNDENMEDAASDTSLDEEDLEDASDSDESGEEGAGGREETPDFYRNSSLGMHTGDLETYEEDDDEDEEDDDEDEDMDDDMPPHIGYDDEATDESLSDSEGEEHIVEVMEEDDDDDEESDDSEDDETDMEDVEDDEEEGSWIDTDEEAAAMGIGHETDEEEDGQILDFVLEGDPDQARELFEQAGHVFQDFDADDALDGMPPPQLLADGDEDEDDEDDMDDHSEGSILEEVFEDGLQPLGLLDPVDAINPAPVDRFGAAWNWTNIPNAAAGQASGTAEQDPATNTINPFAFMRQRPVQSRHRSRRLMDWETDPLAHQPSVVSRYITLNGPMATTGSAALGAGQAGSDVALHPLLRQEGAMDGSADDGGHQGHHASRLHRSNATRREHHGAGQHGLGDWTQSLGELMHAGAAQFLEQLFSRGIGALPSNGGEPIRISINQQPSGMPRMTFGSSSAPSRNMPSQFTAEADNGGEEGAAAGQTSSSSAAPERTFDVVGAVQDSLPLPTYTRWNDVARIVHGPLQSERSSAMQSYLINALRPAFVAESKRKSEMLESEKRKKKEELDEATREKERVEKELNETRAQLEEVQRRQQAGEQAQSGTEQASVPNAEATIVTADDAAAAATSINADSTADTEMQADSQHVATANAQTGEVGNDTSRTETQVEAAEAVVEPVSQQARVTTMINGSEIDITDTGIDPTFLEALPEDMREEVINQHFRERRAAASASTVSAANLGSSSIAPEFLDALPPDLRAEVIQQEAIDNHRRRLESSLRQRSTPSAGADGGAVAPNESRTDTAGLLATLNADLRNAVLMEQDQSILEGLPSTMLAEMEEARRNLQQLHGSTRAGFRNRLQTLTGGASGEASGARRTTAESQSNRHQTGVVDGTDQSAQANVARDAIQLVDKSSVAALVRLMFFPQMDAQQSGLRNVLVNLSENARTRVEMLNLLLLMLADSASSDSQAVDRTYHNFSDRVSRHQLQTPTRPTARRNQSVPATVSFASPATPAAGSESTVVAPISRTGDEAPYLIALRSIEMLSYLTSANEQASYWFLQEDASNSTFVKWLRKNAATPSTAAKGKERSGTSTAPINVLLVLLAKPSILRNAQLVDSLIALLNTITRPLPAIVSTVSKAAAEKTASSTTTTTATSTKPTEGSTSAEQQQQPAITNVVDANASSVSNATSTLPQTLPQIAEDRMASLVKPLSTGISSKGFQNTLAVAQNLASMDGARDVITSALQREAKAAGQNLVNELDRLLESLPPAPVPAHAAGGEDDEQMSGTAENGVTQNDGTDAATIDAVRINSPALTDLASPSSSQTVILRSLRALEWIMTRPKPNAQTNATTGTSSRGHHHHHHHRHIGGPTTVRLL